jgi:rsbT co-antagonist protein RsbR
MADHKTKLPSILRQHETHLVAEWIGELAVAIRGDIIGKGEAEDQARTFVKLLADALQKDAGEDVSTPAWASIREMLAGISASRARQGVTPSETATFIFSFKRPLFARLREEYKQDAGGLASELWTATVLLDKLGLFTIEAFMRTREDIIMRQQRELLELSTPVVSLWESVLALPLIGTLDSERTQVVMESLLQRIVETGASLAIIDITGVPTVDTLVAQHLLKTISAARLMGADCIISGIRPQIAQTIVHLGVDLGSVVTKATLADAFQLALAKSGATIARTMPRA